MGVDYNSTEGKFVLGDGVSSPDWPPWNPGQPNSQSGNCVLWNNDVWEQRNCSEQHDYLCYMQRPHDGMYKIGNQNIFVKSYFKCT